ncbi:beta-1,6-N-acetylglucosaminyltransferase [Paraprevotella xylaniphila]|jgi:hypothetical protein
MRHAILISAHKNISQLCRLAGYFEKDCDVFIHIDKKQPVTREEEEKLRSYQQVKAVSREYDVNWGGTSVLESEMHLLRMAVQRSDADYFHLISGQDYPTRPLDYFLEFFDRNAGKEYIGYLHLPHPNWEDNTFRRLQYYYPYDYAAGKRNPRGWVREQVRQQQAKRAKRPIPDEFDHLYGSSQWWSITRKAATTLLDYTDRFPSLYGRMWMTFAPEECYVATVLVNLMNKEDIVPWNHRFIRWKHENGNRPANLGCEHLHYLLEDEYLFARKIELPCSTVLLDRIDRYLLQDKDIRLMPTGGWRYDGFLKYGHDKKFCDFVTQMWWDIGARTGIDMGCGAGYYVSQWRSRGLAFAGYDANPHTPDLSGMLLPEGDAVCEVADLTEELDIPTPFDIVVCKDVLPYIPEESASTAIRNLARLSSHFILLSWNVTDSLATLPHRNMTDGDIIPHFEKEGYTVEKYMTARLHVVLKRKDCCVLTRQNLPLIDY